ncbi:DUF397 domain-containing protein [Streptomyces sp. NPDC048717]|uniref:DUF397 domain-containing protein n=1 Tax=Streptomyces sp. NPDC048717 TaxID=3154928 RepID=UPI00343C9D0D
MTESLRWFKSSYSNTNSNCVEVAAEWRKSSHSSATSNCVEVATDWLKSSYSNTNSDCVEVSSHLAAAHLRDSKVPDGPSLCVSAAAFSSFVAGVKDARLGA